MSDQAPSTISRAARGNHQWAEAAWAANRLGISDAETTCRAGRPYSLGSYSHRDHPLLHQNLSQDTTDTKSQDPGTKPDRCRLAPTAFFEQNHDRRNAGHKQRDNDQ